MSMSETKDIFYYKEQRRRFPKVEKTAWKIFFNGYLTFPCLMYM